MEYYKIENTPPPERSRGYWRDAVTSLGVGEWFVAPKKDHKFLASAGNNYLAGKYSLYKINDSEYCFLRRK